jgi:predicted nucleic-acid-binding Zn-ribbon protein
MDPGDARERVAQLGDIELVRLLTQDAASSSADVIELATAEANRRGLPIDEAFLPSSEEEIETSAAQRFAAAGSAIQCAHCGHDRFESRAMLLNTRGLTFLKLDWLNQSATVLTCANCGQIQLFAGRPAVLVERE